LQLKGSLVGEPLSPAPRRSLLQVAAPDSDCLAQRLALLEHCAACKGASEVTGACGETQHCREAQQLLRHVEHCHDLACSRELCAKTKVALAHRYMCRTPLCAVCDPAHSAESATQHQRTCRVCIRAEAEQRSASRKSTFYPHTGAA
jgi:hypothetical protein